jgi:pimeloyl-ACP methyl ester carboxylesterase
MAGAFQLILLPGLGADHRLFEPQREAFPQLVVPPWIPPKRRESLPDYAARMAETIKPSRDVPLILGGVSLGGMVAYEMARHLRPDALIQIASSRMRGSFRPSTRMAASTVLWVPWVPLRIWSLAKVLAPPVVRMASCFGARDRRLAVTMFREMDSRFMHWALTAIFRWHPTQYDGVKIFQIHGARDLLIPARRVRADAYIADGGHMINVTHAKIVNAYIAKVAESLRSAPK